MIEGIPGAVEGKAMDVSREVARKVLVGVIDSNPKHRADIVRGLMSFYQMHEFGDAGEAIETLAATPPAAIILDEDVPPGGGLAALVVIRRHPTLAQVPVVAISARGLSPFFGEAERAGAGACLTKPFMRSLLLRTLSKQINKGVEGVWETIEPVQKAALQNTVATFNHISDLIDEGQPVPYEEVKQSCAPLVDAVGRNEFKEILKGVRGHDNYSYVHSLRVATLLSLFGHTIGIRGDDMLTLATGGLLHDVGKMSIPHEVLNKAGRLAGAEWEVMKSHVSKTVSFLHLNPDLPRRVVTIAEQHHEKLDGTGYPNGIKGKSLNELARMASIVDIFGALTDRRVYKPPMPPEKALEIMETMKNEIDQHLLVMFRDMLMDAASDMGAG